MLHFSFARVYTSCAGQCAGLTRILFGHRTETVQASLLFAKTISAILAALMANQFQPFVSFIVAVWSFAKERQNQNAQDASQDRRQDADRLNCSDAFGGIRMHSQCFQSNVSYLETNYLEWFETM